MPRDFYIYEFKGNKLNEKYKIIFNNYNNKWSLIDLSNNFEYELLGNLIKDLKNTFYKISDTSGNSNISFKLYSKHKNEDDYFTHRECIGHGWYMSEYEGDLMLGNKPKMEPYIYNYELECNDSFSLDRMFNLNYLMVMRYDIFL